MLGYLATALPPTCKACSTEVLIDSGTPRWHIFRGLDLYVTCAFRNDCCEVPEKLNFELEIELPITDRRMPRERFSLDM